MDKKRTLEKHIKYYLKDKYWINYDGTFSASLLDRLEINKIWEYNEDKLKEWWKRITEDDFNNHMREATYRMLKDFNIDSDIQWYGFMSRLQWDWSEAIFQMDSCVDLSLTVIQILKDKYYEKWSIKISLLIRLHAKAILISREVSLLTSKGFWEGALARWRNLYELAVTFSFLSKESEEQAIRYIDHWIIQEHKMKKVYNESSEILWHRKYTEEEISELKDNIKGIQDKYGLSPEQFKKFKKDFWWIILVPEDRRDRSFNLLQEMTGYKNFKKYYKRACQSNHAWVNSLENIGILSGDERIICGPSNIGHIDTIQNTVGFLEKITFNLVDVLKEGSFEHDIFDVTLLKLYHTIWENIWKLCIEIENDIRNR